MTIDLSEALAAIGRVKSALDAEEGAFSSVTISAGRIAASSRFLSAASPFPWFGDAIVAGKAFEDVLSRMPSDPDFSIVGDKLIVRAGRFRGEVKLATDASAILEPPEAAGALPLDAATLARFEVLSAFVSDDPQPAWMNSLIVQRGRASACGPGAMVYAYASIPDFGADALIPKRALAAVLGGREPPDKILLTANRAAFWWSDGAWLASNLVDGKVPGTIDRLAEKVASSAIPEELSLEWREAFVRVAGFAAEEIVFRADRMIGRNGIATVDEEVASPVPDGREESKWHKALADLVVANATAWDLSAYPAPSAFAGPVVRGLVTGRS